ncbi:MAG: hypothetical protein WC346_09200 [Methanogenium sp.]|jgi:hypothetical protein
MENKKQMLRKIREERKEVEKEELKEIQKPQKRSVELIEFEDGSFALSNQPLWVIPIQKGEFSDAVEAWRDGSLMGVPLI